jgi:hypothetical protein
MDFSYGPALPLGMEAFREVLEFRSSRRLEARDFLARVNRSVPPGLRFLALEEVAAGSPSLHKLTEKLVYSLDRTDEALATRRSAKELRAAFDRFRETHGGVPAVLRLAGRRLTLELPPDPAKGARAQDIVRELLGIEDPVSLLRRDAVALKIDRPR